MRFMNQGKRFALYNKIKAEKCETYGYPFILEGVSELLMFIKLGYFE